MAVKYGKFELPEHIKVDEAEKTPAFARFIAEPFERGFGHTVGNALRRIMLTSLEAPAILSVRIEGVAHEYTAIEGFIEDMTHIVLNLKKGLLRKLPTEENKDTRAPKSISKTLDITQKMIDDAGGQYAVTFGELVGTTDFDVVNPDLHIFTITQPTTRRVDLKVGMGRGYVPSERHVLAEKVTDEIIIDSAFSPVRLVNYFIENTRVGQDTDYDRLVLEVTTDGRITPEEALTFATQIGITHLRVFDTLSFTPITFDAEEEESDSDRDEVFAKLAQKIDEIELSVRSTNCLAQANIDTIAELVIMPEPELLKFRNFGKKSLFEIREKLEVMGLSLGMDLSRYGLTKENVKDKIHEYINDRLGQEV